MIYPKLVSKLIGLQNQNCLYCKSFSQSQTKVRKIAVKIFNTREERNAREAMTSFNSCWSRNSEQKNVTFRF